MREYKRHYWGRCRGLQTSNPDSVTCRICLYHLGLYTPLAKLKEHQAWQRAHYREYLLRYGLARTVRVTLGEFKAYWGTSE